MNISLLQVRHAGQWKPVQTGWYKLAGNWVQFYGTSVVVTSPPEFIVIPTVTGTATQGQTLTGTMGVVSGSPAPTLARQWLRGPETAIVGATGLTYTLTADDVGFEIIFAVTASNDEASLTQRSLPTAIVNGLSAPLTPPVFTSNPAITGIAAIGSTLTVSNGIVTGNPTPTFSRQWRRNGVNIANATGVTYVVTSADNGAAITAVVTASSTQGTASATTSAVNIAAAPVLLSSPNQTAVSGAPFALLIETSEPCSAVLVGTIDDEKFTIGTDTIGAMAFDRAAPIDVGTNNVYDFTLRITSLASNLSTDIPMTVTVAQPAGLFDFSLSPSEVGVNATVGTVVGDLAASGGSYPADFTLSNTTIADTATVGSVVGSLS